MFPEFEKYSIYRKSKGTVTSANTIPMSKPILVVRFPNNIENERVQLGAERLHRNGVGNDYHILVIKDEFTGGDIKFECFNAPHTEIEFEELQNKVLALMKDK
jgi:hypothetical protein